MIEPLEYGKTPEKGDVVTFTYKGFTRRAAPIEPQIVRVRKDLEWQHVLQNHLQTAVLGKNKYISI